MSDLPEEKKYVLPRWCKTFDWYINGEGRIVIIGRRHLDKQNAPRHNKTQQASG